MNFKQGLVMLTQCSQFFLFFLVTSLSLPRFICIWLVPFAALEVFLCPWVHIIASLKGMHFKF